MSTSATIQFIDDTNMKAAVYSHGDGYPADIHAALLKALPLAWELPRFEADEFAAAFIAGNKVRQGGFRVIQNPKKYGVAYHYVIELKHGGLYVTCYKFDMDDKRKFAFEGPLADMLIWNE
jgi:hypothetical protein